MSNVPGVLIFVIFVVDLEVTKINAYMVHIIIIHDGCGQNIVAVWSSIPSVSKQQ